MAYTAPTLALGAPTPNPCFARPNPSSSGNAAGWTPDLSVTPASVFGASPDRGHQRTQKYTVASPFGTGNILSAPATPGKLCANVSSKISFFAQIKTSGLGGGNSVAFSIIWYNSAGTSVGSSTLATVTTNYSSWTVVTNGITATPPAAAHHFRVNILLTRASGTVVLDVAMVCPGTYDSSASTLTGERVICVGTQVKMAAALDFVSDGSGGFRPVDRDLWVSPRTLSLLWTVVSDDFRQHYEYLWRMSRGRVWDSSAANPNGGSWPIVVSTDVTGLPALFVGYCIDEEYGDDLGEEYWGEPPIWKVSMNLREVV